ncbi:FG-GAP-like repeat-containing protein [Streptomyces sp. NPDC001904]|uniref:FG-GAP-like repeat-containing protein n=1 Tax=Streptomyces sp. NPDC001904 TaxID=3154531 RepID=UPI0033282C39
MKGVEKRPARTRALAAGAVVAMAGTLLLPAGAPAAADDGPAESVIAAQPRFLPRSEVLYTAGETGYLHMQEGTSGVQWSDGASDAARAVANGTLNTGLGAIRAASPSRAVTVTDLGSGDKTSFTVPTGQSWYNTYNESVLMTVVNDTVKGVTTAVHLIAVDGTDQATPLPAGLTITGLAAQDRHGAVLRFHAADGTHFYAVDYSSGAVTEVFASLARSELPTTFALSKDTVLGYQPSGLTAFTTERGRADAPVTRTTVPGPTGSTSTPNASMALAGDRILVSHREAQPTYSQGQKLYAVTIGGGASELLAHTGERFATAPDGSVLAVGGSGAGDWAVRRYAPDGGSSVVREVPPVTADINGLSVAAGRLSVASLNEGNSELGLYTYNLDASGKPGERTLSHIIGSYYANCATGSKCVALYGTGNGQTGYSTGSSVHLPIDRGSFGLVSLPGVTDARIDDISGRYVLLESAAKKKQYIADAEENSDDEIIHTRTTSAAALWGTKQWKPATTTGSVNAYDLKTKKTSADVKLGSGCVPKELQAVGRWLYWNCGPTGKAGVWDLTANKNISVPSGGEALLGDGFLVRHDRGGDGKLLLTDFHGGAGTSVSTRDFAGLPAGNLPTQRHITWDVDRYTGTVVYADDTQRIHIRPTGVPRTPVAAIESTTDDFINLGWTGEAEQNIWHGAFQLSRPAAHWKLTFKDVHGHTARTVTTGRDQGAHLALTWDGKRDDGSVVDGGRYTWALAADAGDGYRTVQSGTTEVGGAKTTYRDYDGNGFGELYAFSSKGTLHADEFHGGEGMWSSSSSGWPTGNRFFPFGDLSGDRCNDVLVRTSSGTLYRYDGACSGAVTTKSPHVSLGTGWTAYDYLTWAGDLTRDGRPDLLARKKSTGDMYVFAGTSAGKLAAGKKIRSAWKTYNQILGAGDLNGDGVGDVLARRTDGTLYRYEGAGDGTLKDRKTVFTQWGSSYRKVIGVGDLNYDGKNDLLVYDTSGRVWRNLGDGKGSFSSRSQVWDGYTNYAGGLS